MEINPRDEKDLEIFEPEELQEYILSRRRTQWTIKQIMDDTIAIQVEFDEDAKISQDFDEVLTIRLDFTSFEPNLQKEYKIRLPKQPKKMNPKLIKPATYEVSSQEAADITTGAVFLTINFFLAGAL